MNKETFDNEIALCQKLAKKNSSKCNWGECQLCGVIPLLYKLHKGEVIDNADEIKKIKNNILN